MDLVAGAMGNLAPKLLQDEYKLQKDVKARVQSLATELKAMHVFLCEVAQVPYDQINPQVKLWASEARAASYDMEDILDTFLVRVDGCHQPPDDAPLFHKGQVSRLLEKMGKMFSLSRYKARREIAVAIEDIKKQVDEMTKRHDRYRVDDAAANSPTTTSIDPRILMTLQTKESDLVGMDEPRDTLIKMLTTCDENASHKEMKIVSVLGFGGLGKTTLAKVVYEKLTVDLNIYCKAFVPVGQNPDVKQVFRDILMELDRQRYMNKTNFMILNGRQLIEEIRTFLKETRYFIVIDDVWEVKSWKDIRTAFEDNNLGSKLMITTRCGDVAELVHCTYKIQPLCLDSSKTLFYRRIFWPQVSCPDGFSELSDKILKKCDGVPLAIITIASLLAIKSHDITEWQEVCNSIGSGLSSSNDMYNDMRKILSLSYYDLPSHMKTCFLYLSMYPEDYDIERDRLIWRWICEGFIQPQKKGDDLFELGNSYFNDLVNRSLVQPVRSYVRSNNDEIDACRVHDMILDLICSLSREENFVTTSYDIEHEMSSESKKLRRLSLKSIEMLPRKGIKQVRCISVFQPCIDSMPSLSCLDMLRVLDLEGCFLKNCEGSKLHIGNLIHLRYLGLRGTGLAVLPGGTEKLQFLQVLKMGGLVPARIEWLECFRHLMCLEGVMCCPRPGSQLSSLASIQVLNALYLDEDSACAVEALGHLTQLKYLRIHIKSELVDQSICDTFINSLGNLPPKLQYLVIDGSTSRINWERWVPPPQLRELIVLLICSRMLPTWINPASLPNLTRLFIGVHTVRPEDNQILGTLSNLVDLTLCADEQNYLEQPLQMFVVRADAFPRLKYGSFQNVLIVPSMFAWGAMPQLEDIRFCLRARDFFSNPAGPGFDDLAINHLPSLRIVHFYIEWETDITEEEATKLEEAVKNTAAVHPNQPMLYYSPRKKCRHTKRKRVEKSIGKHYASTMDNADILKK